MWYVYSREVKSGKEQFVRMSFETAASAIKHIAKCYAIDKDLHQLGEYYYYMKQRWKRQFQPQGERKERPT